MIPADHAAPDAAVTALQLCTTARQRIQPALRAVVGRLPGALGQAGAHHFGWHTAEQSSQHGSGTESGKAVRPALTYLAAEALGSPPESVTSAAVAVELVHNFALIHDDIMDGDATRRSRPALWKRFGLGPALLTGDGMHVLALETLLRHRDERTIFAVGLLNRAMVVTMRGQIRDLSFVQRPWGGPAAVSIAEYRGAAAGKTGALLACATALGALLAGGVPRQVAQLAAFGRHMGIAFQCTDDILGLWGDRTRTGKPVGSDLLRARKTVPVITGLAAGTPAAGRLRNALEQTGGQPAPQDLPEILSLIDEAGGGEAAREEARRQTAQALKALSGIPMAAESQRRFADMAAYLTERTS